MPTELLFRDNAYLTETPATIVAINERGGIELDRTVFYATGGGQPGDAGGKETGPMAMKRKLIVTTAIATSLFVAGCSKQGADNETMPVENASPIASNSVAPATPPPATNRAELLQDAVTALQETENALAALDRRNAKAATAALERATGKLEIVLARNPHMALAPVDVSVITHDVLGSANAVDRLRKSAEDALEDGRLQDARHLIDGLASETIVRESNLPLATYPDAIKAAAALVAQNKLDEAKIALETALSTVVIRDVIQPLPLVRASASIEEARTLAAKQGRTAADDAKLQRLLTAARDQLRLGQALGYASKDEMKALLNTVDEIEKGTRNKADGASIFDKIRGLFDRAKESSQPKPR